MKLFYLADSIIPSLAANSVHVMKMCSAFSRLGHSVTLFVRKNPDSPEDPFHFYGVEPTFQLRYRKVLPQKMNRISKRLYRWCLNKQIRKQVKHGAPDLIYARDVKPLLAVLSLGIPFIFEQHSLPQKKINAGNDCFKSLILSVWWW